MRKVLIKKFIPAQKEPGQKEGSFRTKEGTGIFEKEFTHPALFHCWGHVSEEYESGPSIDTIAIVELPNGEIENCYTHNIIFIDQPDGQWNEISVIDFMDSICAQSLSPEAFEQWENVKKWLINNRKAFKDARP